MAELRGQEKATYVNDMFGRISSRYDLMNRLMTGGQDRRWRAFAVKLAMPGRGRCGMDVATGTGDLAIELASACDEVVGLDNCTEMLGIGREKLVAAGLDRRVKLVQGDALDLPFEDGTFDCVTTGFAMRNVIDIPRAFGEMYRVAKPDGRVVCLEASRPSSSAARLLHHVYFERLVPVIGWIVSGHSDAYAYLPNSLTRFPSPDRLREIMESVGLRGVQYYPLALGGVTIHRGIK